LCLFCNNDNLCLRYLRAIQACGTLSPSRYLQVPGGQHCIYAPSICALPVGYASCVSERPKIPFAMVVYPSTIAFVALTLATNSPGVRFSHSICAPLQVIVIQRSVNGVERKWNALTPGLLIKLFHNFNHI
jgi:hypothetical protein